MGLSSDDAALMARFVATRDRRLFERLFAEHRRAMVAYAGRYVRDPARAEELAQEIFVRVYTTKQYSPDAQFKTWLYRVATNVCLNELRRGEHKRKHESIEDRTIAAPPEETPEAQASSKELAMALERALAALPEKQRAAFIMARYDGLSHDEIAGALSTSVSAVKSLVHRALETLRREAAALIEDAAEPKGAVAR